MSEDLGCSECGCQCRVLPFKPKQTPPERPQYPGGIDDIPFEQGVPNRLFGAYINENGEAV